MSLIQSVPTEIRQLNLDTFRRTLKDLEDDPEGMPFPNTHNHNTTVEVGGVLLSRVIEIINGYTITFEDGQYAVNLVGANSNVGDVVNVNQVSVRSANSAGLQDLSTLLSSAYQGKVVLDMTRGQTGTDVPIGTLFTPSNNAVDALQIADNQGIDTISVVGDYTFTTGHNISNKQIQGQNMTLSTIVIDPSAVAVKCEFSECYLQGILDGGSTVERCLITTLNYVDGFLHQCVLSAGLITLGNNAVAYFLDCYSGVPGYGTPTVDMGGSGQSLAMRGYTGGIELRNKTGPESVSIDLSSGKVILEDTVVAGTIVVRGDGKLTDVNDVHIFSGVWNGGVTIINETTSVLHPHTLESIADAVWDEPLTGATHNVPTSAGRRLRNSASQVITSGTALGSGTGNNQIQFNGDASTVDGAYDPASISIVGGTGFGQSRGILQYAGGDKVATVDRNWKVTPDNTSEYVIFGWVGREHVNEGLAQSGTANTITLNLLASPLNDAYIGQLVFIRSGTGDDQVGHVSAYDGTTKIATVVDNWTVTPDSTSGYAILPSHSSSELVAEAVWTYTRP
jgi:hypothetical protein